MREESENSSSSSSSRSRLVENDQRRRAKQTNKQKGLKQNKLQFSSNNQPSLLLCTHTHNIPQQKCQQVMQDYLAILHHGIVTPTEKPTHYARLPTHSASWNSHPNRKKPAIYGRLPTHYALWNSHSNRSANTLCKTTYPFCTME